MRNRKAQGFTLIELLIVIAIIGILAAVLIPNLLNARARAFDSGAQTCLKELAVQLEVVASNAPFTYADPGFAFTATAGGGGVTLGGAPVNACTGVAVGMTIAAPPTDFALQGQHVNGTTAYLIRNGTGVVPTTQDPGGVAGVPAVP